MDAQQNSENRIRTTSLGCLLLMALGFGAVHRLIVVVLFWLGFFVGLGGKGAQGTAIWDCAATLDFPIPFIVYGVRNYRDYDRVEDFFPWGVPQLIWSFLVGLFVAILFCVFVPRKKSEKQKT